MSDLPIEELRPGLRDALACSNRVIVEAPTGSGKSTRIPQMLIDEFPGRSGQVLVLQPRRIAARMLADRVAWERNVRIGTEVGYQIRLDNVSSEQTRILFLTEGILLRRMLADPQLSGVDAVVLDEFHERHLHGDIALSQCLQLQSTSRPDLALLVMSATLDGDALENFLGDGTKRLRSDGRMFPVDLEFLPRSNPEIPAWELAATAVRDHLPRTDGNILVFMPGAYEIQRTIRELQVELPGEISICGLHGEMPAREQDEAVARGTTRKVIVSTNVAETSLTIDGVTMVVDSGLARVARFDPHRGMDTLHIEKISRASADQRAGRAGRTAPGLCIRLWTRHEHERRPEKETPEIHRVDLSETLLQLAAFGISDFTAFRWLDAPDPDAIEKAAELLRDLGAIHRHDSTITPIGRSMLDFPVHPRYARMFLEAETLGCSEQAALAAAITQSRSPLARCDRKTEEHREDLFGGEESDFVFLFRAVEFARQNQFRADACRRVGVHGEAARLVDRLRNQFLDILASRRRSGRDHATDLPDSELDPARAIARCVLAGFSDHVARRKSAGNYLCDLVGGRTAHLPKTSQAGGAWLLVAAEIREIGRSSGEVTTELGLASAIEEDWLEEIFPEDFVDSRETVWDPTQKRVVLRLHRRFRDLVIEQKDRDALPGPEATACLVEQILSGTIPLDAWGDEAEELITRIHFLADAFPELEIQKIQPEDRKLLLSQFCEDAVCLRDLKDRSPLPAIRAWLPPEQAAQLDRLAPRKIPLSANRSAKVLYQGSNAPKIAVKIQDLFGVRRTPAIGGGRVPLTVEILAPNHRPVQVTRDLEGFWKNTYPEIMPPLKRRYPKHHWEPVG